MKVIFQSLLLLLFIISESVYSFSDSTFSKKIIGDAYYQIIPQGDSAYTIIWGKKDFLNTSDRIYKIGEVTGGGYYAFETANKEAIILSGIGEENCKNYLILPLYKGAYERYFDFVKALDIENNLLAYVERINNFTIVIVNYLTYQMMEIVEERHCPGAVPAECIEECYFKNDSLVLKWQGANWTADKPDLQIKSYPIELSELNEDFVFPGVLGVIYGKKDIAEYFAKEEKLDSGDIEFRLWELDGSYCNTRGFQVTKRGGMWSASAFRQEKIINVKISDIYQSFGGKLKKVYIAPAEPANGWDNFYDKVINKYKIFTPPPIPDVWCLDDCLTLILEVYHQGQWRVYDYQSFNEEYEIIKELYSFCENEFD